MALITYVMILITFIIYNFRNVVRLEKEINFYGYKILSTPYFKIEEVKSEEIYSIGKFKIYSPLNDKMCWASKTPCSYRKNIKVVEKNNFKIVLRNDQ